ncbi:MAG TPA: hypothetical protein VHZ24_10910 [Pirellulales bacterium]|nr:hypothetical protein [Pirellulales bacterium]
MSSIPSMSTAGKSSQDDRQALKDWFAGQVIAAMIGSDPSFSSQRDDNGKLCGLNTSRLANMATNAYQVANALVQARMDS